MRNILSILITLGIVGGALYLAMDTGSASRTVSKEVTENVKMVDGKQMVNLRAKGGYLPGDSMAKAGVPTVLKLDTDATFDCSIALAIPALGYRKNLPTSGETLVDIPADKAVGDLKGACTMGMYAFTVHFR